jgi:hypothetical protein
MMSDATSALGVEIRTKDIAELVADGLARFP